MHASDNEAGQVARAYEQGALTGDMQLAHHTSWVYRLDAAARPCVLLKRGDTGRVINSKLD